MSETNEEKVLTSEQIESSKKVQGYTFGEIKEPIVAGEVHFVGGKNDEKPKDIDETKNNIINENLERLERLANEERSNSIKNKSLKSYKVKDIIGASKLEPLIVFVEAEIEGKIENLGIPGFFDSGNDRFMLLNGAPIDAGDFDDRFSDFINKKKSEIGIDKK